MKYKIQYSIYKKDFSKENWKTLSISSNRDNIVSKSVYYYEYLKEDNKLFDIIIKDEDKYILWWRYDNSREAAIRGYRNSNFKFDMLNPNTNWYYISIFQKLSAGFIREFQNKVDWDNISFYQELSEDFIIEFKDRVRWHNIFEKQNVSEEFIEEFKMEYDEYKITNDKYKDIKTTNIKI